MRIETLLGAGLVLVLAAAAVAPAWTRVILYGICHQDSSRALWIGGVPMALCARCFGLVSGAAVALLCRVRARADVIAFTVVIMTVDLVSEWFALRPAWAVTRFASGALVGATLPALNSQFAIRNSQ